MSTDVITLTVNGVQHTVDSKVPIDTKLIDYLRNDLNLKGTRATCREGGCGACTVVASVPDPNTGGSKTFSVNSCLASVYNCDGWSITTNEGLGNEQDGYHPIQEALANNYGTQCGFCSSGMVMNMHGLTQGSATWTDEDVEKNLDGHICRCTGYRPILTAFKSVTPTDIEEADKILCSKKSAKSGCCGGGGCGRSRRGARKEIVVDGVTWYSPTSIGEMLAQMAALPQGSSFQFMFGHTGNALFPEAPDAIISTRNIAELSDVIITSSVVNAGCAVSITTLKAAFKQASAQSGFEYLNEIDNHWQKVASTSVRNLGSWAGNLAMKSKNDFTSDLFCTLVACGAEVLVGKTDGSTTWVLVENILGMDFQANREVMLRLRLFPIELDATYRSYKIMARSANTPAYVSGSFKIRVDPNAAYTVLDTPIIAYNAISPTFVRATNTETYLQGKSLTDEAVLQGALTTLASELIPETGYVDPDPSYKIGVAQGLLYRTILAVIEQSGVLDSSVLSAATPLVRPVSSGTQVYDQNTTTWPLGQPIPKIESKQQCAGEIRYMEDMPTQSDELYATLVQSTKANAAIDSIDASAALAVEGVVGFVSAEDIPGINDMYPSAATDQPVFASGRVMYYGQAVGMIVATSDAASKQGAALVNVVYSDVQTPVITIDDALINNMFPAQPPKFTRGDVLAGFAGSTTVVEGEMYRGSQYHFHMECQAARVVPNENNYDVYATTQHPDGTQAAIAKVLGIQDNKVNVSVSRLGGGFGAKIDQCNLVSAAAAVGAEKFRRPVRLVLDLTTNMTLIGWRNPFKFSYKVGVDATGKLMAIQATMVDDTGCTRVDANATAAAFLMESCYSCPNWEVTPVLVRTDTATNTWCRTPGTIEGITFMEYALEHVARELQMDPLEFRKLNLIPDGGSRLANILPVRLRQELYLSGLLENVKNPGTITMEISRNLIVDMITQIEQEADVANRKLQIAQFNSQNRWRKRGLSVMPMLWPHTIPNRYGFGVFIAIYAHDATVMISHGGIEMGQGINTKVCQVAAYILGCGLDKIVVKPTTTVTGANSSITGGSLGSEINSWCIQKAAELIKARLDSVYVDGMTWEENVSRANTAGLSLSEYYWNGPGELNSYPVYGVACTEVELDLLTGNFLVLQTDILEDAGTSTSPLVDIGQVEGSWLHGQGLFTTEAVKHDPVTGEKLTNDTLTYRVPLALDIPTDLRVTLLQNTPNPLGVLSSKVTNEPPVCLAFALPMALREAIASARADAGSTGWFQYDMPLSVDRIHALSLVDASQFGYGPPLKGGKKRVTKKVK